MRIEEVVHYLLRVDQEELKTLHKALIESIDSFTTEEEAETATDLYHLIGDMIS